MHYLSLVFFFLFGGHNYFSASAADNPSLHPWPVPEQPEYKHQIFGPRCDPFENMPADQKVYRRIEINYPKGSDLAIPPRTFDEIVDSQVVERAMAIYACTNHMHDQRDLAASVIGVGLGHDLSIEGLSYFSRAMAFARLGLDSLAQQTTAEFYFNAAQSVREVARRHLKDPKNLKGEYEKYKPILVGGFKKSKAPEHIRAYLNAVIPYFTQPVPENVLAAERVLVAAEVKCNGLPWDSAEGTACYEQEDAARNALIAITPDYRVLQWMHRRQAEGGDALVKAWGEVLTDFAKSI